jgi:succinyl-diaminopimelate desuccinylase
LYKEEVYKYKDEIVENTKKLIRIQSVEGQPQEDCPFGRPVKEALDFVLNLGNELGFETKNIDNYAGHIEIGRGEEIMGISGHVDVVPATREGWKFDPFDPVVHEGLIYGRGVLDDKGPIIASLYAMKAAKELGCKFNRRVRLILGTNEETRWEGIKYYLQKEKEPDFTVVPDADFPLINGEKGIIMLKCTKKLTCENKELFIEGGEVANSVPKSSTAHMDGDLEKTQQINELIRPGGLEISKTEKGVKINSYGKAAHGSTPDMGENAISKLLSFLDKIEFENPEIQEFVDMYNENIGLDFNGTNIGLNFEDEPSGKLTMNVGKIFVDEKKIQIEIDMRYPFCTTYDEVMGIVQGFFADNGYDVQVMSKKRKIYKNRNDQLVKGLMKIYRETSGDMETEPLVIGGGTYARAFENALAFGPLFPGVEDTCHQKDESMSIDDLMRFTEIYLKTIVEFSCVK